MSNKIYAVVGYEDYGASWLVKAFYNKSRAEKFEEDANEWVRKFNLWYSKQDYYAPGFHVIFGEKVKENPYDTKAADGYYVEEVEIVA